MNTHITSLLVVALAALAASPNSQAGPFPQCDTVQFSGATQQFEPDTPFVGDMNITNLATGATQTVNVVTMLLGYASADGGQVLTSHEIRGTSVSGIGLVTFDEAQLIPEGQGSFTLISHMKVKSGKGHYNCGELLIGADPFNPENNSRVVFDLFGLGHAEYSGFGRLCRCQPSDN